MNVEIKQISTQEALIVRRTVLRKNKLHLSARFKEDGKKDTIHIGAMVNKCVIGTSTIFPENRKSKLDEWRLRGMAVLDTFQSKGIGEKILLYCFKQVDNKKGSALWCDARLKAIKFYEKNGFIICSSQFDIPEIGPHFKMEKLFY